MFNNNVSNYGSEMKHLTINTAQIPTVASRMKLRRYFATNILKTETWQFISHMSQKNPKFSNIKFLHLLNPDFTRYLDIIKMNAKNLSV